MRSRGMKEVGRNDLKEGQEGRVRRATLDKGWAYDDGGIPVGDLSVIICLC